MNMKDAVASVFRNYATFSGRACRSEYWWFFLFNLIASFILSALDGPGPGPMRHGAGMLSSIWWLANVIPSLAVAVRRLHDTGRSGWWLLLGLIPLIGQIVLIVWFASRGTPGANPHGEDPLAGGLAASSVPRVPRDPR